MKSLTLRGLSCIQLVNDRFARPRWVMSRAAWQEGGFIWCYLEHHFCSCCKNTCDLFINTYSLLSVLFLHCKNTCEIFINTYSMLSVLFLHCKNTCKIFIYIIECSDKFCLDEFDAVSDVLKENRKWSLV